MINKSLEMADVVRALEKVRGAPVLTSNQCWDLAKALNANHSEESLGMVDRAAPVVERQEPDTVDAFGRPYPGRLAYSQGDRRYVNGWNDACSHWEKQPAPVAAVPCCLHCWDTGRIPVTGRGAAFGVTNACPHCLDDVKRLNEVKP